MSLNSKVCVAGMCITDAAAVRTGLAASVLSRWPLDLSVCHNVLGHGQTLGRYSQT